MHPRASGEDGMTNQLYRHTKGFFVQKVRALQRSHSPEIQRPTYVSHVRKNRKHNTWMVD